MSRSGDSSDEWKKRLPPPYATFAKRMRLVDFMNESGMQGVVVATLCEELHTYNGNIMESLTMDNFFEFDLDKQGAPDTLPWVRKDEVPREVNGLPIPLRVMYASPTKQIVFDWDQPKSDDSEPAVELYHYVGDKTIIPQCRQYAVDARYDGRTLGPIELWYASSKVNGEYYVWPRKATFQIQSIQFQIDFSGNQAVARKLYNQYRDAVQLLPAVNRAGFRNANRDCIQIHYKFNDFPMDVPTDVKLNKHFEYVDNLSGLSGDIVVQVKPVAKDASDLGNSQFRVIKYMKVPVSHRTGTPRFTNKTILHELQTMCILSKGEHFPKIESYGTTCSKGFPKDWLAKMEKSKRGLKRIAPGVCGVYVVMEYLSGYRPLMDMASKTLDALPDRQLLLILHGIMSAVAEGTKLLHGYEFNQTDMHAGNVMVKIVDNMVRGVKLVDFASVQYPEGRGGGQAFRAIPPRQSHIQSLSEIKHYLFASFLVKKLNAEQRAVVSEQLKAWARAKMNNVQIAFRIMCLRVSMHFNSETLKDYVNDLALNRYRNLGNVNAPAFWLDRLAVLINSDGKVPPEKSVSATHARKAKSGEEATKKRNKTESLLLAAAPRYGSAPERKHRAVRS